MVQNSSSSSTVSLGSLLEEVLDEILEGFQVISSDWKYIYINEVMAQQSKKAREELLGRTVMECFPGLENTPLFVQLKRCMNERVTLRMENLYQFPDQSKGWFDLCIHPWIGGILIFSVDITNRKSLEEKFNQGVQELQSLIPDETNDEKMLKIRRALHDIQQSISAPSSTLMAH
jgi:two-component system, sensor histidine kinase PdtaS